MVKKITTTDIRYMFDKYFKGSKNFITPNILKYGKRKNNIYEISTGTGLENDLIYGLTVLNIKDIKDIYDIKAINHDHDLSKGGFKTLKEVKEYIDNNL